MTTTLPAMAQPAYLTEALNRTGVLGEGRVVGVEVMSSFGTMTAAFVRLRLACEGAAAGAPRSLILKAAHPDRRRARRHGARQEVAFYRDMLGFFEIDGGEGNAVLASGQTRLVLRSIPEVAPVNRRLMHLNLEVDDLQRVHDELKSKGVRFTYAPRAVNRGARLELWAAAFRDPDGHGIAIIEWRERQRGSAEDDASDVPDVGPDGGEHQAHPQQ